MTDSQGDLTEKFSPFKKKMKLLLLKLMGKTIFSIEQVTEKFKVLRTVLITQLLKKKNHFLDFEEISHKATWISHDFELFLDNMKELRMLEKCHQQSKRKKQTQFKKKM